jgi:peptidoglycan/LPS O-acetylase OafA/YrhL
MGVIRLLLALSVVLAHSSSIFGFNLVGGFIAVKSFYIISGFYMSLVLNEKYIGNKSSYGLFISNRFLRLYPVYWVVLILTVCCSLLFYYGLNNDLFSAYNFYLEYMSKMNFWSIAFLIFANVFLFFQDIVMFLGLDLSTGALYFTENFQNTNPQLFRFLFVPQAWTIGVELTFYLIAPFIVRRNWKVIVCLIFLSLGLRFYLIRTGLDFDPWTYRFFPTELVFFLLGNISYLILKKIRTVQIKPLHQYLVLGFMLFFTLFYSFLPDIFKMNIYFICFFILLPVVFNKTKNWKWDSYLGELSYPIYISHLFLLNLIFYFDIAYFAGQGLTLSVISILFSMLLNQAVTKRIEIIRQRRVITRT